MTAVAVLLLRFGSGVAEVALATLPSTHWLCIARTLPRSQIVIAAPGFSDGVVQVVVPQLLVGGVAQETPAGAVMPSKMVESLMATFWAWSWPRFVTVIVKVSFTNTPPGIRGADALFVTAISADVAAEAGTAAMRDAARVDAETTASPFLNTRERRNIADFRSAAVAINPFITFLRVVVVVGARWPGQT
jgi:hypothetical protein